MDKNSAYTQFLKQWDKGIAKYLHTNNKNKNKDNVKMKCK